MGKVSRWLGPVGGILFVASVVARGAIRGELDSEPADSATTALAEFRDNAGDIELGVYIAVLGVGFLVLLLAHLRAKFLDAGAGWVADAFLAGGVLLAAGLVVYSAVELAGATAGDHGHAEVAQLVVDFSWNWAIMLSPGLLTVGIAAAVASFSHRTLPRWLGAIAVVVALGALAPWMGIFVFVVWVLAASIFEFTQISRPAVAADVR